ncbi:hypothetical protein CKM354_000538000 [Cercospora kikuchii]|uniref:Uncharacterized protein n=1 Tax=Cercospora kikuchii TaxID=84275 RepID=A0A9P3CLX1_9PEZI|nr:uncharacterized protein CKM354_000538000 [Cercospora kikuchii]GIZ42100.1 hypothetical protein CKM354_000538000 [Cercospora kikuchii]
MASMATYELTRNDGIVQVSLDSLNCEDFPGNPILPTGTNGACGFRATNRTALEACCPPESEVQEHLGCFLYCEYPGLNASGAASFGSCIAGTGNQTTNQDTDQSNGQQRATDAFCQYGFRLRINATAISTSAARHIQPPRISNVLLGLLLLTIFWLPVSANHFRPQAMSSTGLHQRQSEGCEFEQTSSSILAGQEVPISGPSSCATGSSEGVCGLDFLIEDTMTISNRTINGTLAVTSEYDDFFEMLSQKTSRPFPAVSSVKSNYVAVLPVGQNGLLYWIPFLHCAQGMARGCAGVIDSDEPTMLEACAPLVQVEAEGDSTTQGSFRVQYLG